MEKQTEYEVGFRRNLSSVNVWALSFGCMISIGAFFMPGTRLLPTAGPKGTLIAILIAMVLAAVLAVNYQYMIQKYPGAGGVFLFAEKCFGKGHAFFCTWFLSLAYIMIIPLNATACAMLGRAMYSSIYEVGVSYSVGGSKVFLPEVVTAMILLVAFGFLSMRSVRLCGQIQSVLAFLLLCGVVVVSVWMWIRKGMQPPQLQPAFASGKYPVLQVVGAATMMPFAFVGFESVAHTSEEYWFTNMKLPAIFACVIVPGVLIYMLLTLIVSEGVPGGYENWQAYLKDMNHLQGLESFPVFYCVYDGLGRIGLFILCLAAMAAIMTGILGFYIVSARLIYAMAREGMLPAVFARIGKSQMPENAVLCVMAVSVSAVFLGYTSIGWIVDYASVGAVIGFGYTSAAAYRCAREEENGMVKSCGMLGMVSSVVFLILCLTPNPFSYNRLRPEGYLLLAVWSGAGFVVFWNYLRKKNLTGA